MINVIVLQMIDYTALNDTSHKSISGGIASHSLNQINEFKASNLKDALRLIEKNYGKPFIFEDRLELQVNDSETLSFYLEVITKVEHNDLLNEFKNVLEIY